MKTSELKALKPEHIRSHFLDRIGKHEHLIR
jgi:hypothetical protein